MQNSDLKKMHAIELPINTHVNIMNSVYKAQKHQARVNFGITLSSSFVSVLAFVFSTKFLISESLQTGLFDYMSLVFSDTSTLLSYWQDFLLAIIDAVPVFGLVAVSGTLIAFIWSSARAVGSSRLAFIKI